MTIPVGTDLETLAEAWYGPFDQLATRDTSGLDKSWYGPFYAVVQVTVAPPPSFQAHHLMPFFA